MLMPTGGFPHLPGGRRWKPEGRLELNRYWHPGKVALTGFVVGAFAFLALELYASAIGSRGLDPRKEATLFLATTLTGTFLFAITALSANRRQKKARNSLPMRKEP